MAPTRPLVAAALMAVLLAGCHGNAADPNPSPSGLAGAPVPATGSTASFVASESPTQASAPASAPAGHEDSRVLHLALGQTAHLAFFDVTLLRSQRGQDSVSHGWKVQVCYTHRHPDENANGTTRISSNPWQALTAGDGSAARWIRIDDLPGDDGWTPPYPTRFLSVGQCALGWLAVKQDPDTAFQALRYAPVDSGDVVTWREG